MTQEMRNKGNLKRNMKSGLSKEKESLRSQETPKPRASTYRWASDTEN
jgi:hypothetical protein